MTRAYSVRTTALILDVPVKWIDNLLSHNVVPGVEGGGRGVERRISDDGLLAIEIVRILHFELGVPVAQAATVARTAARSVDSSVLTHRVRGGMSISFSLPEIQERLRSGLVDATEAAGAVARG